MTTATHTALGYRASRDADGALVIHDVPIFVECERGEHVFDAGWIADAVNLAKQQEREGYLPPLHIRHHEPATEATNAVRAAGFFRITRAAPITFKGARRVAIYADLIITDPGTQDEVLAKRLPYRSVEIFNVDRPAINGMALLDHEAPFLELPMLMVSDVDGQRPDSAHARGLRAVPGGTFRAGWQMDARVNDGAVVACFRHGAHAHLLINSERIDTMTKRNFADDGDKAEDKDKPEGKDKSENMEGEGLDVGAVVKAIEDGSISVADMDAIIAAIQKQKGAAAEEEEEEAPAAPAAPAAAPGGEAMKASDTLRADFARMKGENEALKARLDARDEADATKADVEGAMERLRGKPLGSDLRERLINFRKDHGAKAFRSYVDGLAGAVAIIPTDGDAAARFTGQAGKVSEVAMKYQGQGTDAVDKAAAFSREWRTLYDGGHTRMSEERYVAINMERATAAK